MTGAVEILAAEPIGPFEFRWPDATEAFEGGWLANARIGESQHKVRHGIGARTTYGRERVHTVTWVDGAVQVEGVEADDYPASQALISRILRLDRKTARTWEEVPAGYEGFEIVEHRREIDDRYSPYCLAVKIREDDVASWALHAWLRSQLPPRRTRTPAAKSATLSRPVLPPPPTPNAQAVCRALLAHANTMTDQMLTGPTSRFTPNEDADRLVREDPFAFLLAVISDMGIRAERAWALPTTCASGSASSHRGNWPPIQRACGLQSSRNPSCTGSSTTCRPGWSRRPRSSSTSTKATRAGSGPTRQRPPFFASGWRSSPA